MIESNLPETIWKVFFWHYFCSCIFKTISLILGTPAWFKLMDSHDFTIFFSPPRETWIRYYSPDQRDHLLHYVLAERYDYKEFLWRETRCTEHFRQWIKSMSDMIRVKVTWGGKEMLQALSLSSGDAETRSQKEQWDHRLTQAYCCFDDSHSTSIFSPLFKRLNILTPGFSVIKHKSVILLWRPHLSQKMEIGKCISPLLWPIVTSV